MNRLTLAFLVLSAGLLTSVQATTLTALTLEQQAKKADVIVQATVGTPTTVSEGGQTFAVYPLKVSETLAGDVSLLPQVPGGQGVTGPALYVLSGMELAPVFQSGQEAVLLLYKGRLDSPLVGFNQGAFLISNGQVSVLPIQLVPGQAQQAGQGVVSTPPVTPPTSASQPAATQNPATQNPATQNPSFPAQPSTAPTAQLPDPQAASGQPVATQTSATQTPPTTNQPAVTLTPTLQPAPIATVLGSLKTPAELKAAIVAARAAK